MDEITLTIHPVYLAAAGAAIEQYIRVIDVLADELNPIEKANFQRDLKGALNTFEKTLEEVFHTDIIEDNSPLNVKIIKGK